jgi:hypothetical protein
MRVPETTGYVHSVPTHAHHNKSGTERLGRPNGLSKRRRFRPLFLSLRMNQLLHGSDSAAFGRFQRSSPGTICTVAMMEQQVPQVMIFFWSGQNALGISPCDSVSCLRIASRSFAFCSKATVVCH